VDRNIRNSGCFVIKIKYQVALAERKHELMWKIKNELSHASKKRKGDKIRKKLWEELGVMI